MGGGNISKLSLAFGHQPTERVNDISISRTRCINRNRSAPNFPLRSPHCWDWMRITQSRLRCTVWCAREIVWVRGGDRHLRREAELKRNRFTKEKIPDSIVQFSRKEFIDYKVVILSKPIDPVDPLRIGIVCHRKQTATAKIRPNKMNHSILSPHNYPVIPFL